MSFNALYIDYYLCGGIHSKGYAPGEQTTALLQELTAILDRLQSDDYEPNLHTINILQNILKRFATNPPKEINIMDMYFSARMHLSYSYPSKRKSIKSPLTNRRSIWYNLYTLIREPQLNI